MQATDLKRKNGKVSPEQSIKTTKSVSQIQSATRTRSTRRSSLSPAKLSSTIATSRSNLTRQSLITEFAAPAIPAIRIITLSKDDLEVDSVSEVDEILRFVDEAIERLPVESKIAAPLPVRVVPVAIIPVSMSRQARRCMEAAAAMQPKSPLQLPTSSPVRPLTVAKRLLSDTAITVSCLACSPSDIVKDDVLTPPPLLAQSSSSVFSGSSDNTVKNPEMNSANILFSGLALPFEAFEYLSSIQDERERTSSAASNSVKTIEMASAELSRQRVESAVQTLSTGIATTIPVGTLQSFPDNRQSLGRYVSDQQHSSSSVIHESDLVYMRQMSSSVQLSKTSSSRVQLPLPTSYQLLSNMFSHFEATLSVMRLRREFALFSEVKNEVEKLGKRNFNKEHLAQITFLFPEGYQLLATEHKSKEGFNYGEKVAEISIRLRPESEFCSSINATTVTTGGGPMPMAAQVATNTSAPLDVLASQMCALLTQATLSHRSRIFHARLWQRLIDEYKMFLRDTLSEVQPLFCPYSMRVWHTSFIRDRFEKLPPIPQLMISWQSVLPTLAPRASYSVVQTLINSLPQRRNANSALVAKAIEKIFPSAVSSSALATMAPSDGKTVLGKSPSTPVMCHSPTSVHIAAVPNIRPQSASTVTLALPEPELELNAIELRFLARPVPTTLRGLVSPMVLAKVRLREAQLEADRLLGADRMRERRVTLKEALVALDAMHFMFVGEHRLTMEYDHEFLPKLCSSLRIEAESALARMSTLLSDVPYFCHCEELSHTATAKKPKVCLSLTPGARNVNFGRARQQLKSEMEELQNILRRNNCTY